MPIETLISLCKLPKVGKIKENEEDRPKSTKSLLQNPFWEVGSEVANAHGWNLSRILHFLCFSIVLVRSLIANKQHSIRPKKKKKILGEGKTCMHKQIHTYIYTKKREKLREREREREPGAEVVFNKKRVGGYGERRRGREKKHCYFLVVLLLVSLLTL